MNQRGERESDALAEGVLASLRDHVAVLDRDGSIIAVNDAWRRFARENDARSSAAVSAGANYLGVCRRVAGKDDDYAKRAIAGIEAVISGTEEWFSMEYPCSSPQEVRWFVMTAVPLKRPEGGAVISHTNITARKEAEMKLRDREADLRGSREEYRALARKLLTAQEETRRRVARELHDDFSQRMALLSMSMSRLAKEKGKPDVIEKGLAEVHAEMVKLSSDIHAIARQLHPSILDDLGLHDAVASLCKSFAPLEGAPVACEIHNIPAGLPRDVALALYRIIQEGLANSLKHARAKEIRISLVGGEDSIDLSIVDDGVGFDIARAERKEGLGLASMRERVDLIGGELAIVTEPGKGTEITVTVPFRAS